MNTISHPNGITLAYSDEWTKGHTYDRRDIYHFHRLVGVVYRQSISRTISRYHAVANLNGAKGPQTDTFINAINWIAENLEPTTNPELEQPSNQETEQPR